jgi:hypothetical protein
MTVTEYKAPPKEGDQSNWYSFMTDYWTKKTPEVPECGDLNFCTVDQLRQHSETLTTVISDANGKISTIEARLQAVNDHTQGIFTEALAKDAIAYDKLKELFTKAYDIKHSIFTTLPDSKQFAASCFPTDALALSQKRSWDHFDTLSEQINLLCSSPASQETIQSIDISISKLIFLTHKLAMRKLEMIRELNQPSPNREQSFESQKELLESSFSQRNEQFQAIHSTLLQSKEKLAELTIEDPKVAVVEVKEDEKESATVYSYVAPVISYITSKTYTTGFEAKPNSIFHQLITEYLQAKEFAQESLSDYQKQRDEGFKVFKEHELVTNERARLIEKKQRIAILIQEKITFTQQPQLILGPRLGTDYSDTGHFDSDAQW